VVRGFWLIRTCALLVLAAVLLAPSLGWARATATGMRLGAHPDGITRIVVDLSDSIDFSTALYADPYRVVVNTPPMDWSQQAALRRPLGAVQALRFDEDSLGGRLMIDLKDPATVKSAFVIPPRDGQGWRFVMDLQAVSRAAFLNAAMPSARTAKAEAKPEPVKAEARVEPPKPAAVLWAARASAAPLVASLTRSGDLVVALDGRGAVHAVDPDGRIAWSLPGDALAATAFDRFVAVASAEGLSVRDGVDGSERGRFSYGFAPSAPSAKPVAVPEGLAVATPRGIALLRSENAVLVREIPVDGGVVSAPTLAGRELACVSGDGSLVLIDLGAGIVSAKIPVGLGSGPFPPRGRGDFLVVGDRGGRLAGVSASARAVLWTRDLGTRLGIEPEIGEGRLFAWTADKKLLTLSTEDGSELAPPVVDVLSPPLLSDGRLYWGGKAGVLVVADAANMREVKRIPIAEGVTVRPIIVGGTLYAGTGGGRIVKVDISR